MFPETNGKFTNYHGIFLSQKTVTRRGQVKHVTVDASGLYMQVTEVGKIETAS
jgi:hypothetical protein